MTTPSAHDAGSSPQSSSQASLPSVFVSVWGNTRPVKVRLLRASCTEATVPQEHGNYMAMDFSTAAEDRVSIFYLPSNPPLLFWTFESMPLARETLDCHPQSPQTSFRLDRLMASASASHPPSWSVAFGLYLAIGSGAAARQLHGSYMASQEPGDRPQHRLK